MYTIEALILLLNLHRPSHAYGFLRPFLVAQQSKRPNIDFGRTPVKAPFGRTTVKDRFIIFGCGTPKMGKKSWEETLHTTGVKFRGESEVPGWHFATKVPGWHSALCRVPPQHIAPDGSK